MLKKIKLIAAPILIFCLLVLLCGAIKLLGYRSQKLANDLVTVQSKEMDSAGEYQENSINIIIRTKCDSLELYMSDDTISELFDIYIDEKAADFDQTVSIDRNEYTVDYSKTYGDMTVVINSHADINSIFIDAPAANMNIRNLTLAELALNTNAGNIVCYDIYSDSIVVSSQNGSVNIKDTESTVMKISSQSGKICINSYSREFYMSTTSGTIEFVPVDIDLRADITTESGDIYVRFDENDDVTMYIKQKTGIIRVSDDYVLNENKYMKGSGYSVINIYTDEGNIIIE